MNHKNDMGGKMKKWSLVMILTTILGCAGASYSPYTNFSGKGYQETRLDAIRYQVMFQGDGHNTPLEVRNLFLRRCAELTLAEGYPEFEIITEQPSSKLNALVNWPSHTGEIKLIRNKTELSINAEIILKTTAKEM